MAQYKVPQDVEAEDKFLGPLTFKQFLFAGGVMVFGYLSFWTITSSLWFFSVIFILPTIAFATLAFPWSKEQPTEIWLASRIRFLLVPKKRLWDQSGVIDLVKINVPKREAHVYTDGLDQVQVKSRLNALATMVDSRGWAVKNFDPNSSDRLAQATIAQPDGAVLKAKNESDVMDEDTSNIAKQFETMIQQSETEHKAEARQVIEEARGKTQTKDSSDKHTSDVKSEDFWFMHQKANPDPGYSTFQATQSVSPGGQPITSSNDDDTTDKDEENALLDKVHEKQRRDKLQTHSHHEKTVDPKALEKEKLEADRLEKERLEAEKTAVTPKTDPDIINLASSNDLNVETIARQANKKKDGLDDGEVVISLH